MDKLTDRTPRPAVSFGAMGRAPKRGRTTDEAATARGAERRRPDASGSSRHVPYVSFGAILR